MHLKRYTASLLTALLLPLSLGTASAENTLTLTTAAPKVTIQTESGVLVGQTAPSGFRHFLSGGASLPLPALTLDTSESFAPLDIDYRVKGKMLKLENLSEDGTTYRDDSIYAVTTTDYVEYDDFKGKGYTNCHIVRITISDPSQLRTGVSYDDYEGNRNVHARLLAESCNAVAAVNGDFFKNTLTRGYIFRQGVFYRNQAHKERDVLLIDSEGDFHVIEKADKDSIEAAFSALPEGVSPVNVINFGPALIENGVVANLEESTVGTNEDKEDQFYYNYRNPRVAIVQLGHLQYALVECDAEKADGHSGMTLQTFAEYIADLFPDAVLAYNLDGGNSTNVLFPRLGWGSRGQEIQFARIHNFPESRQICDILYFASLVD